MVGCKRNGYWYSDEGSMGHNNTGESNSYALTFTDKNPSFQPFIMKGWPHYDAIFDLMLKKIKGTHVFQPSNRSQGAAFNNIRQSQPTTAANSSGPSALPSTSNDHHNLRELLLQSFSPVVTPHLSFPSIMTSSCAKYKQSAHQSANSLPMTLCQCQMWTSLLLVVRLALAQSNRRSMDQWPSYQPVKNSRASTPPSKTFWNPKRQGTGQLNYPVLHLW